LNGYAEITAAIVGVQLGRDDATEARQFQERRIPFLFYTGRADLTVLRAQWPDVASQEASDARADRDGSYIAAAPASGTILGLARNLREAFRCMSTWIIHLTP